jgi:hypothetical protein
MVRARDWDMNNVSNVVQGDLEVVHRVTWVSIFSVRVELIAPRMI